MTLFRLVYYSANAIDADEDSFRAEVEQILQTSRRNNDLVGVTGALMFSAGYFGQVLEGPQAAIEATFERIQQDPRHGDVSLLEFAPVSERAFDNWAMAYVGDDTRAFETASSDAAIDPQRISGNALFARLRAMVAAEGVTAP
jgi:hypothetical protein